MIFLANNVKKVQLSVLFVLMGISKKVHIVLKNVNKDFIKIIWEDVQNVEKGAKFVQVLVAVQSALTQN